MRKTQSDLNRALIIAALRAIGCDVRDASRLGSGFPDLICGYKGDNILIATRPLSARAEKFISRWRGTVCVVSDPEQAIKAVRGYSI